MEEDKRHKRKRINENIFVGIISGVIVLFIGFIGTLIWTYLIFPNLSNPDDNSSSSPAQSVESNPIISTTPVPEPTSTPVLPTQTPSSVPAPAQTPVPTPTPIMTPMPVSPEDSYDGSALSEGMNVADDPLGEAQPDTDQYVVTGSIPEPPIDD